MSLTEIASKYDVSRYKVTNIANRKFGEKIIEKFFPYSSEGAQLGTNFHSIFQKKFKEILKNKGLEVYIEFETLEVIPRYKEQGVRGDILIVVTETLRKRHDIPDHIKYIAMEITTDQSQNKVTNDIMQNYHGEDTYLIQSSWAFGKKRRKKPYIIPEEAMFKENIFFLQLL